MTRGMVERLGVNWKNIIPEKEGFTHELIDEYQSYGPYYKFGPEMAFKYFKDLAESMGREVFRTPICTLVNRTENDGNVILTLKWWAVII